MSGRVLSEEEIKMIEKLSARDDMTTALLIATIRDRDKTISELQTESIRDTSDIIELQQQNTILREALKLIAIYPGDCCKMPKYAREALAKVKEDE